MEIILSSNCMSVTGSLGHGFGYHIQRRTDLDGTIRYWGVRKSRGAIPADGHLKFIFACAEIAQNKLHIADIRVSAKEVRSAFNEARLMFGDRLVKADAQQIYNAREVLDFKKWCSL